MTNINIHKSKLTQKDIDKGQKIVAAIYLVTNHLSENEPIRVELRSLSIKFVQAPLSQAEEIISHIDILLGSAVISALISEKNSSVIIYEIRRYLDNLKTEDSLPISEKLFSSNETNPASQISHIKDIKRTVIQSPQKDKIDKAQNMSFTKKLDKKDARQNKILSFINDKKSAVIKDITSLFPEVSEKTIQRELSTLIENGSITKRGSKRWSIYMAVNSLL